MKLNKKAALAIGMVVMVAAAMLVFVRCGRDKSSHDEAEIDTIGVIVAQARKCSKLYTAEYKVHKIVTHSDEAKLSGQLLNHDISIKLPVGKRKVAIPIDATVKAYIDMSQLSESDVVRDGDKVEVRLPNPTVVITSTSIDHASIKQHVALLRHDFTDEELSSYERLGRQAIEAATNEMDIRETARHGAAMVIIPMMVKMGFDEANITVTFADDEGQKLLNGDIEKS